MGSSSRSRFPRGETITGSKHSLGAPETEGSHGLNRPSNSHGVFRARLTLVRIYSTPAVGSDPAFPSHVSSPCASYDSTYDLPPPRFFVVVVRKRMKRCSGSRMLLKVLTSRLPTLRGLPLALPELLLHGKLALPFRSGSQRGATSRRRRGLVPEPARSRGAHGDGSGGTWGRHP